MSNSFGIPREVLEKIMPQDRKCAYCHKLMKTHAELKSTINKFSDQDSIEHLYFKKPFYWYDEYGNRTTLEKQGLAICCRGCNSSRRDKSLKAWFELDYCKKRDKPINETTVSNQVKQYIRSRKSKGLDY